jgi:ERCC4-type nuclease
MGKQRVAQLLTQLKENQTKDIENAASIYTVAKVAVDALDQAQVPQLESPIPEISKITKAELLKQYGNFNGCRKAAKELGIKFKKTPSWEKLEVAFSYQKACQQLVQNYLKTYPNKAVEGVSFDIHL